MKGPRIAAVALILAFAGGMAYVRLAPDDPVRWHVAPPVMAVTAAAQGRADIAPARATPRTTLLAGAPETGMITWVTRSRLFGFPEYPTAAATPAAGGCRLDIVARQRFGRGDMGVNAARLRDWLGQLAP